MDKQEQESMEKQKATKYSDEAIQNYLNSSSMWMMDGEALNAIAEAQAAQAMIAYNNMIDRRWKK